MRRGGKRVRGLRGKAYTKVFMLVQSEKDRCLDIALQEVAARQAIRIEALALGGIRSRRHRA